MPLTLDEITAITGEAFKPLRWRPIIGLVKLGDWLQVHLIHLAIAEDSRACISAKAAVAGKLYGGLTFWHLWWSPAEVDDSEH